MSKHINAKLLNEVAEILAVEDSKHIMGKRKLEENMVAVSQLELQFDDVLKMQNQILSLLKTDISNQELLKNIRETKNALLSPAQNFGTEAIETLEVENDWDKNLDSVRRYAKEQGIDLSNPYFKMFSNVELIQINHQLVEKFDLCRLDKFDYYMAVSSGIIAGLIDVFLVGTIGKESKASVLQEKVNTCYDVVVKKYGMLERRQELKVQKKEACAKSPGKAKEISKNFNSKIEQVKKWDTKDSIKYLEKRHKVSYDLSVNKGSTPGLHPSNHHLLSLAHEPSLLGLVVGVMDQLSGTVTLILPDGHLKRLPSESKLALANQSNPIMAIIEAVQNWFGHIMSDIAGSGTSKQKGAGLPVPGWAALEKLQFGKIKIGRNTMTISGVAEWMYKNGYDVRAFTAQLIPVLINETLLRIYWFYKQHFYYGKSMEESIPIANNRELARLLLVSTATFSSLDFGDAFLKSGGNTGKLLMTVNIPETIDFGFRAVQNVRNEVLHGQQVRRIVDTDIEREWERILSS